MDIPADMLSAVKKGLGWKTVLTTFVTVTVIGVTMKQAKKGTFGTKISTFTAKYL